MSEADLDALTNQLAKTTVGSSGVSFEGRSLKLDTEEDASEVIDAIKNCASLEYLNLAGNTLGVDAAKGIAKALESHGEFKRALWMDLFTGRMKTEIPKALQFLGGGLVLSGARLSELDLSDNAFGPIGVEGLAALLRSAACYQLQVLKLNNNGLGITGGKLLAKALLDCHKNSTDEGKPLALKVFVAGRNRLENEGAKALAEVFKRVATLEEVSMPQNGIYHVGISALCDALANNKNLRHLNLNDNTITSKGASSIATVLANVDKLEYLDLGDSLLKTKGAFILANALTKGHFELMELHLGFNEINAYAGMALVKAMRNKSKLKVLRLGGNNFGEEGVKNLEIELKNSGGAEVDLNMSDDEGLPDDDEDDNEDDDDEEEQEEEDDDEEEQVRVEGKAVEVELEEDDDEDYEDIEEEEEVICQDISESVNGIDSSSHNQKNNTDFPNFEQDVISVLNEDVAEVSISEFLMCPSADNFWKLGGDRNEVILLYVKEHSFEGYLDNLLLILMQVSALCSCGFEKIEKSALSCSDILFRELFRWGSENEISLVNNGLLIHLGLLKSEDKSFTTPWNLTGCLIALHEAIKKDYFPASSRECIQLFLQRRASKKVEQVTLD